MPACRSLSAHSVPAVETLEHGINIPGFSTVTQL